MVKIISIFLFFPFLLNGTFEGCGKQPLSDEKEFDAKVVASFCSFTILEIKDPAYTDLGMDWKEYQNVFTVANPCDLPEGMQVGKTYRCRIIEKAEITDCIQCMGYMDTPPLKRYVKLLL